MGLVILTWKRIGAVILIVFSIFINWEYRKPDPNVGISGEGMKTQIKSMLMRECCEKEEVLHSFVENCMRPRRVCVFDGMYSDVNIIRE